MAISGKFGTVKVGANDVCEVTKWSFTPSCNVSKYASNKTGGYKKGVAGIFDSKGSVEVKLDETNSLDFLVGNHPVLELHVDNTGNNYYEVPAIIAEAPIECDIDEGEVVSATYEFEGNGPWIAHGSVA